jgi:hypothetical protein
MIVAALAVLVLSGTAFAVSGFYRGRTSQGLSISFAVFDCNEPQTGLNAALCATGEAGGLSSLKYVARYHCTDGSHVRLATRVRIPVFIQNGGVIDEKLRLGKGDSAHLTGTVYLNAVIGTLTETIKVSGGRCTTGRVHFDARPTGG